MSKFWRQLGLHTAVGLVSEFVIIYVGVVLLIQDRDNTLWLTLFGLAGLYAFRVVNWLIGMVVSTVSYYLTKRQRVSATVALFYHHHVPVNDSTRFADGSDLLEAIANSDDASPQAKRFALMSLGELSGIRLSNRVLGLMQMYAVIDAAWERYRSEVNAKHA